MNRGMKSWAGILIHLKITKLLALLQLCSVSSCFLYGLIPKENNIFFFPMPRHRTALAKQSFCWHTEPLIATNCAQYPLLQFLCRCPVFDFPGVESAYWNLEEIIFTKIWGKKNHIFLLHSKEKNVALYLSYLYHWHPLRPKTLIPCFIVWQMMLRLGSPCGERAARTFREGSM